MVDDIREEHQNHSLDSGLTSHVSANDEYFFVDRARGCLVTGAIGDALGAPVEFMKKDQIESIYGKGGIQQLDTAYGYKGAVTDDTQMTLFAAEGLINAYRRGSYRGILGPYWTYTAMSYQRWLTTQDNYNANFKNLEGWGDKSLYEKIKIQGQRGPGDTCVSALKSMPNPAELAQNNSKGCGTVMRVAPIGIFFGSQLKNMGKDDLRGVYDEAVADAAITHGHQTAQHASGVLAVIYALVLHGVSLESAIHQSLEWFGAPDINPLCEQAVDFASQLPRYENLKALGEGWVAEEALAISLYCALLCINNNLSPADALRFAVNHDGDSDSTGSITGNLIGICLGTDGIPREILIHPSEVASLEGILWDYGELLVKPFNKYPMGRLEKAFRVSFGTSLPTALFNGIALMPWGEDSVLFGTKEAIERKSPDLRPDQLREQAEGYCVIGFWGHGINSHALQFSRKNTWSELSLRLPYGGVYMDDDVEGKNITNFFAKFIVFEDQLKHSGLVDRVHVSAYSNMGDGYYELSVDGHDSVRYDLPFTDIDTVQKHLNDLLAL